jgi:integrase
VVIPTYPDHSRAISVPKLSITDLAVHKLRTPGTYWDASLPAFGIRVGKTRKTWLIVPDQRRVRKVIGHYPAMPVAKARDTARKLLASRSPYHAVLFGEALDQFLELLKANTRLSTYNGTSRHLEGYLRPALAKRPLADVKTNEVMDIIDELRDRPSEGAHAFGAAKQFFRWASGRGYCAHILDRLKAPSKSTARARVLTDREIQSIWQATVAPTNFNAIVRLLLLTGQRRGEIAGLRKEWICDDLVTFPPEITKNGRAHSFPIAPLSRSILSSEDIPSIGLLFPQKHGKPGTHFLGWSKAKSQLDEKCGIKDWTLHDLRRTFASNIAALGVRLEVIEKLLNHVSGSFAGVAGIYNRYDFAPEMRAAVELWEIRLKTILGEP